MSNAPLRTFFYHSRLSPDGDLTCVTAIVKGARSFNANHGITGALVFDGERFCQYIEGPSGDLDGLIERLAADVRHTGFTPLLSGETVEHLFPDWSMAYANLDDGTYLDNLVVLEPQHALSSLQATLGTLDVG